MDKKLILYIALGFVLFALWNAWQHDHGQKKPKPVATTAVSAPAVGQAPLSPELSHLQHHPAAKMSPKERIIQVKTDVLNVAIDTLGGNIVAASLPKYAKTLKTPNVPMQILTHEPKHFYVAQSGLIGLQDRPLQYKASRKSYLLTRGQRALRVMLTWQGKNGVKVSKTYTFTAGSYAIAMNYKLKNGSNKGLLAKFYTQIQRAKPAHIGGFFSLHTFTGAAVSSPKDRYEKISFSKMSKHDLERDIDGGWVAMQQRYFLTAWIPAQHKVHHYYTKAMNDHLYTIGMSTPIGKIAPKEQVAVGSKLYVGPELTENLAPLAPGLDRTIDFGFLWFISMALFWLMKLIFKYVGNWGWSIIIVTILVRALFYKLTNTGFRSMAKMRTMTPKMQALKEKFAGDKQKLSQATMELYKKEKANPLSGCLPQLVQIPVLFALYYVLIEAVQLRHAPFIFWITDLSAKDPLFILPILLGISMFISQKLTPSSPDPTQAKMFMMMPIFLTALFAMFPAGLVLYYLVNNVLMLLQQWLVLRKHEQKRT